MPSHTIYHNLVIKSSPEIVYKTVSDPFELEKWWPLKCSGQPVLGGEYNLNFTDKYNWFGLVTRLEKDKSFHIKMTKSDPDWDPTTFGFDLERKNGSTYLRFSHYGWKEENDHFKHSSFCWALLLHGLKTYLENGIIILFEERA